MFRTSHQHLVAIIIVLIITTQALGQSGDIRGVVKDETGITLVGAQIRLLPDSIGTVSNTEGRFAFEGLIQSTYVLEINYLGKQTLFDTVRLVGNSVTTTHVLKNSSVVLDDIEVSAKSDGQFGVARLNQVEGTAIYSSKKNEVVVLKDMTANLAANLSRQVYAKVPGLNIWESDGAGVQLGIGGRGLSPNRNSNFNTRQNGYDISADALGYPESYYSPPVEAIERIEVVRGAASLQYGTQFGGMLNFRFREPSEGQPLSILSRQTAGSFGFFSSFNQISGSTPGLKYNAFYQYKRTDGWRPNSELDQHTAHASLEFKVAPKVTIKPEYTYMYYLAHQPGGLTDAQFEADPSQSNRERNWFEVKWNLMAVTLDYKISEHTELNSRTFGLIAGRDALGNLSNINLADFGGNRDYISDDFRNWGNETRVVHRYSINGQPAALVGGIRYYHGFTHRRQGDGNDGSGPDFYYLNPDSLEGSDFDLPSRNFSAFAEHVFNLSEQWSITPGVRFEYIYTAANGYYRNTVRDLADNVLLDEFIHEMESNERSFLFAGLGVSYKPKPGLELYGNISQNYRAINFNDIRVNVGGLIVDPDLMDERGFNADIGFRGNIESLLNFDISVFHLNYQDRIGTILKKEPNPNFNNLIDRVVRFRTNIADARIYGIEGYAELSLLEALSVSATRTDLTAFANIAVLHARYTNSEERAVEGNQVELVPPVNIKSGLGFRHANFRASLQFGYVAQQYSDASNAERTANAVEGIIPAYHVMDFSVGYAWKVLLIDAGVNNVTNNSYFTRRASGYPGPGIIPSEPRSFYVTLGVKL